MYVAVIFYPAADIPSIYTILSISYILAQSSFLVVVHECRYVVVINL